MRVPPGPVAQSRLERTPDKREVDGSNPSRPTIQAEADPRLFGHGGVAQLGERLPCTQEADGSNPFTSTSYAKSTISGLGRNPGRAPGRGSLTIRCEWKKAFNLSLWRITFVVKLLRADGGCLGAKRRRKTWKAAISFGEPPNRL